MFNKDEVHFDVGWHMTDQRVALNTELNTRRVDLNSHTCLIITLHQIAGPFCFIWLPSREHCIEEIEIDIHQ